MATGGELNRAEGSRANPLSDGRISGLGKIIYITENCGLLYSTNKQKIYFGERHFHPFVKGIFGTLERGSYLHFEAKQSKKGGTKLTYSATKVWRTDVEESFESTLSKKKRDGKAALEAINFLRSILDVQLSLTLSSIYPLLSEAPRNVQDMLSSKKEIKKLLKRFPSVFQYSATADAVSLVDETVHGAIDCVVDLFKDDSCLDLGLVFKGVSAAPREIRQLLGHNEVDFLKFLTQYHDVFQVSKGDKDGRFSVSLRLSSAADEATDSYDTQSVDSSCSQDTCSGSSGVRSLSSALSVLSLDALSKLHGSGTTSPSPDGPAKQRGIAKLLNALADKEPTSLGSLIGYIHSSPPDVRDAVGNKMDKFTEFVKNDNNFLLLEPQNLVFIRNCVEKKALEYLVSVVTKHKTVKVTDLLDLLRSDSDRAPAEVAALFGMSEISVSVRKLLRRQELLPRCNLVLQNDLISIRPSSHQFDAKSIISDSSSTAVGGDKVPKAAYSVPSEGSSFPSACEGKAVEFLRSVVKRHKLLAVLNVKSHLGQASVEIRQLLGNEKLIRDFVKRHPSVFKSFVTEDVIQLVDDDVRDAVEFFSRILTLRGDLLISSLVGHQSSAPARIRLATGGNPVCVTEFLMRHFDVFHVYEGKNGLMVALVGQKSLQQFDLSSVKQKISASFQCPTSADFAAVRPVAVDQKGVSRKADGETGTCSDDPELDFLVGLLKSRGVMCLQDIVRCVSDAPTEIQDDLGCGDDEVLSYIEENPAIFKVSQGGRCVELVSEDEGDAIEFFLDILNKRGATPVSKIHGHLSQAADSIRKVTGGSPESVASFLLSFPNVFRTFRDKDIEMIESLYEGKGDSGGSLPSSDVERSPKLRPSDSDDVTVNEAASRFDKIDFGSIVGLPQLRSNVAASATLLPEVISSFVGGATGVQESALHGGAQFSEDSGTKSNDACKSELNRIEGTCYGHSQKQISDTFVAFDKNDHRNDERTILASESGLSDNFQVELATETPPGGANVPSGAMLQSNDSQLELLSVINLVRSAKDEQNVVADLCYETFSSRGRRGGGGGGGSLGTAELLSICHLADPLDKKWQNTLGLKSLTEILEADGRFVFNKTNNRVFLRKDVERMAVEFLQNCIRFNGPIELSNLKYCDYLKRAGAEVRTVLSRGESSSKFKRSMVNNLWRKYRDQLNQEDRYLVIPCDVETLAIAFLSKLIETLGPIPVNVLSQHLLHAPVEVSWFFEEKCCLDIKLYLSSLSLGRHFIVVEDMVDLVRSGNLDKNRLVVEQQAVSFLVDVIRTHGPILLSAKKVDFLRTAAPAVRQLLGNEWNTCFWKNKLLKKLCLKRDEVFTVGKKTIGLIGSAVEAASYDSSTSTFAGDGIWSSQSARDATLEFLLGLMSDGGGVLDLRLRELRKHALFAAPPQARILLGGELNSFQLKKNLVVAFCSSYPEIFTVNKKSVLFLNRASGSMKTPVVLGSPSRGLKPTNHGDDAFLGGNDVSSVAPVKGVAEVGEETTCDVRHVACSDIPTCAANQPEFSLNAANISTATVSVFNISNTSMAFNYGPSTQISPADSPSCQSQGIAAACLPAVCTPVAKGSVSEDSELADQSSDENSNENLETSELSDFHCGDFCLSTNCDALLEKNISNTDSKHLRPDGLSTLSSVSRSSQDSTCAARVTASRQKSSIPVNCGSVAMSSQVLNFGEEFDRPLGDLCQYIDLLHMDALKIGSLATVDDDFGDVWHANDAEQRSVDVDEDAVVKGNGTVLSAEGTLLYIKCEDGRLISCSSENCSGRFSKCQNIGRHFAIGEKVDVVSERLSKRVSVRRSSSGRTTRRSENQRGKETVSHLEEADEVCCSDARIKSGRGRVSVLSSDVIAVMMGSLEMAAFTGRHSRRLALNDAVSFSARRAQHFMAPWQLDDIRTDRRDDVDTGQGSSAELLHLISASTTNGDVIKVSERNSVDDDDVIASGSPY